MADPTTPSAAIDAEVEAPSFRQVNTLCGELATSGQIDRAVIVGQLWRAFEALLRERQSRPAEVAAARADEREKCILRVEEEADFERLHGNTEHARAHRAMAQYLAARRKRAPTPPAGGASDA